MCNKVCLFPSFTRNIHIRDITQSIESIERKGERVCCSEENIDKNRIKTEPVKKPKLTVNSERPKRSRCFRHRDNLSLSHICFKSHRYELIGTRKWKNKKKVNELILPTYNRYTR